MQPRISVYIPSHKRPDKLSCALDSVLNQTFSNFEVIVVLDGMCERSLKYLKDKSKVDTRVSFLINERPKGACNARNRAIDLAKGEFITGLDDDDLMKPDCLQTYIKNWSDDYSFLCASYDFSGDGSKSINSKAEVITQSDLIKMNSVGNQIFTKTNILKRTLFDESLNAWQDYDCWLRILEFTPSKSLKLPNKLYFIDVNPNRESITTCSNAAKGAVQFLQKHVTLYNGKIHFWLFNDSANRRQPIPFWLVFSLLGTSMFYRGLYLSLKHSRYYRLAVGCKNIFAKVVNFFRG